ncbi:MAG: class E sortase [Candidatus Geothermincolales bacterium]
MKRKPIKKYIWALLALTVLIFGASFLLIVRERRAGTSPEEAGTPASAGSATPGTASSLGDRVQAEISFPCKLRIPALGLELEVQEGAHERWRLHLLLREGPVHLPWTSPPGGKGNCVISGHRTTYTRPFHRLDELKEGDEILLGSENGFHVYKVYRVFQVGYWVDVTGWTVDPTLTLTTCTPKGSSSHRLVVRASYQGFVGGDHGDR